MKLAKWIIGSVMLALLLAALPLNASAGSRTILPGGSFTVNVNVDMGQMVTYSWSSDYGLHFTVTDPDGVLVTDENSNFGFDMMTASASGTYHFTWQNTGISSAHLTYTSDFFGNLHNGLSIVVWGILIGVIVVIVVVVVIVFVIMSGERSRKQPVQQYGPVGLQMAPVGGICPMCGSPVDPRGMFCAKCGAKLR